MRGKKILQGKPQPDEKTAEKTAKTAATAGKVIYNKKRKPPASAQIHPLTMGGPATQHVQAAYLQVSDIQL